MTADHVPQHQPDENKSFAQSPDQRTVEQRVLNAYLWVVGAAVIGMCLLGAVALVIPLEGFWPNAGQPFATVLGGLAVLGGGALALYNGGKTRETDKDIASTENNRVRELADNEHTRESLKELNDRFAVAAAQLGNENVAIRLAGTYAMAALADDWSTQGNAEQTQESASMFYVDIFEPIQPMTTARFAIPFWPQLSGV